MVYRRYGTRFEGNISMVRCAALVCVFLASVANGQMPENATSALQKSVTLIPPYPKVRLTRSTSTSEGYSRTTTAPSALLLANGALILSFSV